jgi:hypothetical protein
MEDSKIKGREESMQGYKKGRWKRRKKMMERRRKVEANEINKERKEEKYRNIIDRIVCSHFNGNL